MPQMHTSQPYVPPPLEDYALLSDCRTGALVSRTGSIDWFCPPRYDAPSIFGALLGGDEQGRWELRPQDRDASVERHYDGDTFVLVTRWETATGTAEVHEALITPAPHLPGGGDSDVHRTDLVRRVIGIEGEVAFETTLRMRFDYARATPWVRQRGDHAGPVLHAEAGPDAVIVRGVRLTATDHSHSGIFTIAQGETRDLVLTWSRSYRHTPAVLDVDAALADTRNWWSAWADRIDADRDGEYNALVVRSLLVLRALSHRDTGGVVAAATTSLPEEFGGGRNWDYRYVWLRDASLTLQVLVRHGFVREAEYWRTWLLRAIAGDVTQMQIVYGVAGERDLTERELDSLPGYRDSSPVRVGNGAVTQYQADVIGEVMVALAAARAAGMPRDDFGWSLERALLEQAERWLDRPDNGIWEMRGEPRHFTHSRAMTWAAFDRGVHAVEHEHFHGPVERWRELRDRLRDEIDAQGVGEYGGFVQSYGSDEVDASLLLIAQVGFCSYSDPRMLATIERIESDLVRDGLVLRYRTAGGSDGLTGDENAFLACSFWLVEQYANTGRHAEASTLMKRACAAANDLGLLSEEYDATAGLQAGNLPQAFSHLTLVRAADALGH